MDIEKYIGYYSDVWEHDLNCDGIIETNYDYQPSTYSNRRMVVVLVRQNHPSQKIVSFRWCVSCVRAGEAKRGEAAGGCEALGF